MSHCLTNSGLGVRPTWRGLFCAITAVAIKVVATSRSGILLCMGEFTGFLHTPPFNTVVMMVSSQTANRDEFFASRLHVAGFVHAAGGNHRGVSVPIPGEPKSYK